MEQKFIKLRKFAGFLLSLAPDELKAQSARFDVMIIGKMKINGLLSGEGTIYSHGNVFTGRFEEYLPFGKVTLELPN